MRVLLVNGSPRVDGNTGAVLDLVTAALREDPAHEVTRLELRARRIEGCNGCAACEPVGRCVIPDDMQPVFDQIRAADLLILGTPTYFGTVSGLMKTFMDRTNPLWWKRELRGKAGGAVIVESGEAGLLAEHTIWEFFREHGMFYWGGARFTGEHPGDVLGHRHTAPLLRKLVARWRQAAGEAG